MLIVDRTNDSLYFGDEVEYTIVKFDADNKKARLCLKAQYYLDKLNKETQGEKVCFPITSVVASVVC